MVRNDFADPLEPSPTLVRHPDKTKDPSAEERFVSIKQAYELLSDPERRKKYDDKGITEDDFYNKPEHPPFQTTHAFDDIFGSHGAHFNFQENDITFFHKLSITARYRGHDLLNQLQFSLQAI